MLLPQEGCTPLHAACFSKHISTATLLINAHCDVNAQNNVSYVTSCVPEYLVSHVQVWLDFGTKAVKCIAIIM